MSDSKKNWRKSQSTIAPSHHKLIDLAINLQDRADCRQPNCYMPRIFVQATLPHQEPCLPAGALYTRDTGLFILTISPTSVKYGIPYGRVPRLILAWICTEIKRTKSRVLQLGNCQAEFMRKVGLMHGDSRDIARFKEQSMRLFCCVIGIEVLADGNREASRRVLVSDSLDILWHPFDAAKASTWASTLLISEGFFTEVMTSAVPLKMEAYRSLSKSPLAMDVYAWTVYRLFLLGRKSRRSVSIPWHRLQRQFGSNYGGPGNQGLHSFKKNFKLQLRKVLLHYPEASELITESPNGQQLILYAGRTHIDSRPCG
jgi:hypothetical protein